MQKTILFFLFCCNFVCYVIQNTAFKLFTPLAQISHQTNKMLSTLLQKKVKHIQKLISLKKYLTYNFLLLPWQVETYVLIPNLSENYEKSLNPPKNTTICINLLHIYVQCNVHRYVFEFSLLHQAKGGRADQSIMDGTIQSRRNV